MKRSGWFHDCNIRLSLIFTVACVAATGLNAQDHTNLPPVTITTRTNLVLIPAVVDEGSGKHISGLSKNDFEIVENGKSKPIAVFEEVKTTAKRMDRFPSQPGVYTNMLSSDNSPKRLTIFALDAVNTPFLDQTYARQQLIRFLAHRVSAQEPCALISIQGNGIRVLHDFSSDPAVLVAALKKVVGHLPGLTFTGQELESQGSDPTLSQRSQLEIESQTAAVNDFVSGADQAYAVAAQRNNILATLETFQHVAEAFAGVPGRKSLIWVTAGFPFGLDPTTGALLAPRVFSQGNTSGINAMDRTGGLPELPSSNVIRANDDLKPLAPLYERTIQMLNDANISVYPVDARGLVVYFPDATTHKVAGLEAFNNALFEASRETMVGFADMTGGMAFYNRNDLDAAFAKAADDSDSYYMLGYYLDKNAKPGWHKLQVKLQHGGGHVRARNGFFVTPESRQSDTRKTDIKLALASPLDYTGLPVSVRWTGTQQAGGKKKVSFQLVLAPSAGVVDEGNNNHLSVEMVAVARTAKGEPADQYAEHVETNLKPGDMPALHKDGINYNSSLLVPPGEYSVRFVVRDNLTGRLGSVLAPLKTAP
jgi:VWFA-related protein